MKDTTTLRFFNKFRIVVILYLVVSIVIACGWHMLLAANLTRGLWVMWESRPQGTRIYIDILLYLVYVQWSLTFLSFVFSITLSILKYKKSNYISMLSMLGLNTVIAIISLVSLIILIRGETMLFVLIQLIVIFFEFALIVGTSYIIYKSFLTIKNTDTEERVYS